ncbi:hypothetical protein CB0101_00525 [Synechococcus sp. CB0101]|uniref:protease pro-enzyme activation domain-containing protein n=1 Tax=Synechococcus sp. CB0101 TaxID=232348 RepID=UPI0010A9D122|nr:protease pro-enzyme activation domain-containing protein [Synechococcus sp. CB0101]QCH13614.1 hypothetical protein CB0101_00525 [Synechococcus sp. CB0101]
MLHQIRNSNQFASWVPGAYLTPSDYLEGTPGNNLPDSQKRSLTDETKINVQFILRRNTFETTEKPEGFIKSNELLNLPYRQQASFINNLNSEDIRSWYGASEGDLTAVANYLLKNNATNVEANQEQRSVKATLTLGDFKSAFLAGRRDIVFSEGLRICSTTIIQEILLILI